jgi:hypothetical protein
VTHAYSTFIHFLLYCKSLPHSSTTPSAGSGAAEVLKLRKKQCFSAHPPTLWPFHHSDLALALGEAELHTAAGAHCSEGVADTCPRAATHPQAEWTCLAAEIEGYAEQGGHSYNGDSLIWVPKLKGKNGLENLN